MYVSMRLCIDISDDLNAKLEELALKRFQKVRGGKIVLVREALEEKVARDLSVATPEKPKHLPRISGQPKLRQKIIDMAASGMNASEIAQAVGYPRTTIIKYIPAGEKKAKSED